MSYLPLPVVPASLQAAVGQLPVSVLLCASLEAVLFATHAQVLLALGPSRSFKELKDRRWYFLIDLLSPWAALVAAASTSRSVSAALLRLPLLALLAGHALLHAFYIATWHSSRHTDRVIQLSSSDAKRRFSGGRYGAAELAWYHAGVLLDLLTHGTMVTLLLRGSGGGASTGGSGGV